MVQEQAELVDLPQEQDQKPKINIFTPKIIILVILSLYFVGQNIYYNMTVQAPKNVPSVKVVEVDQWQQSWEMFLKFQHYFYVSVIGFVVLYFLRRANDRHDQEVFQRQQKEEQQKEEGERRKQAEREERIIRQIQREEKAAEERQLGMASQKQKQPNVITNPKEDVKAKDD